MFTTVIIILLLLITVGLLVGASRVKTRSRAPGEYQDFPKKLALRIGAAVLLAVAILVSSLSVFYSQDPGKAVLIRSFTGEVVGVTEDSGIHFKTPWQSTNEFDIRNQSIEMHTNNGGEGKDGSALSVPLSGSATATVSATVIYSINASAIEDIYNNFGNQAGLLDNALKPRVRSVVRDEGTKFTPQQIKENRAAYATAIQENLQAGWERFGVTVDQVNIGDVTLDEKTEAAISATVAANQNVEKVRADLSAALIQAEITKTDAQASADADQIIRCGATVTSEDRVLDGKTTTVSIVTPKSNAECENRLNEQVLATKWFDTIKQSSAQGNLIIMAPADGSAPIINVPAPTR